jgi:hypothetical protein
MQTVRLMTKDAPKLVTKLKYIDIYQYWLRQEVVREHLKIKWVLTNEMSVDGFTKQLPRQKHEQFVNQLNIVDIKGIIKE